MDIEMLTILEKIKQQQKISVEEQVKYMSFKGIEFKESDEASAIKTLSENTYYYKMTAFRKNFKRNSDGKYQNLDLKHLSDLAIIDMHLRYLLMKLTLDIEHSLKTKIISSITKGDDDGYSIVGEYNNYQKSNFNSWIERKNISEKEQAEQQAKYIDVVDKIMNERSNRKNYDYDLYCKRIKKPSIWVLLELMTFGQLSSFIKFYCEQNLFESSKYEVAKIFLPYSKNVRNCAAHSRTILLYLNQEFQFGSKESPSRYPHKKLTDYVIRTDFSNNRIYPNLTNMRVHDLVSLLFLHDTYVESSGIRDSRKAELEELLNRCKRNEDLYINHPWLNEKYNMFSEIIKTY
ncbi:hypothetical protein IGL98_000020 [Enterococcus sp. DIV0840]|uniref:Abi family protein n=1 Tax=unclassified Enterococcus TaxID=2608891 RepID=UPI001A8E5EF3|nr:Abi family protein [Enterococcus sp. DIV0849a]MBO0434307.1 Abi family protein [Enterococcus sp. DIV0849a]